MIGILLLFTGISLATFTAIDVVRDPPKMEEKVHEDQERYND